MRPGGSQSVVDWLGAHLRYRLPLVVWVCVMVSAFLGVVQVVGLVAPSLGGLVGWLGLLVGPPAGLVGLHEIHRRAPALSPFLTVGPRPLPLGMSASEPNMVGPAYGPSYAVIVGTTFEGAPVVISPENRAGMLVSGVPGCGKTITLRLLLAAWQLAGAEVHVIDLKDAGDFEAFDAPQRTVVGDDIDAAIARLRAVTEVLERRMDWLRTSAGEANYWLRAERPPLLVMAIDEVQELFEVAGLGKERKDQAELAAALLRSLVKRGRAAGIFVVLSTQKADATAIPTSLRDQIAVRLSGEQKTREASRAAMGELRDDDPQPHRDIVPGSPGVMIASGHGPVTQLFTARYVTPESVAHALAASSLAQGDRA